MRFGLNEVTIEQLSTVFETNPKVDKALIFGSRAKGNYRNDSDIDIAIKGYNITSKDVLQLSSSLEDVDIAYKVDIVGYESIKEPALVEHIDRIGVELYSSWREWKLSEITEPIKTPFNPLTGGECPYIGLEHIEQGTLRLKGVGCSSEVTSNKFRFQANDILFGKLRPYFRKVVKPDFDGVCSTDIWVFRAKAGVSQDYLFYFLANSIFIETANGGEGGSRMPRADWNFLKNSLWEIPKKEEQIAIAAALSALDDKIDLLHRQNNTLEGLAETLFRQWFIEEDGQRHGALSDVLDLVYGKALKDDVRSGDGYPVVGSSGIVGYHSSYLVEGPGIVIGRKGTLGSVSYLFDSFHPIDTTYFVRSKINSQGMFYEYFLLKTMNFGEMNSDSAVPGLNRDIALSTEIKVPDRSRIHEFNEYCRQLFENINSNTLQIRTIAKLRDNLLPKLMSGEIKLGLT